MATPAIEKMPEVRSQAPPLSAQRQTREPRASYRRLKVATYARARGNFAGHAAKLPCTPQSLFGQVSTASSRSGIAPSSGTV
jgi:hypothetical protein